MNRTRPRTIHELADFLFGIAQTLKELPDADLNALTRQMRAHNRHKSSVEALPPERKAELKNLCATLRELPREEAERKLSELSRNELRFVCQCLSIGGVSKASKEEIKRRVLYELFDFHLGHELIRGFSKRRS